MFYDLFMIAGIFEQLFLKTLKYAWHEPFTLIKAVRDRQRFRHACGLSPPTYVTLVKNRRRTFFWLLLCLHNMRRVARVYSASRKHSEKKNSLNSTTNRKKKFNFITVSWGNTVLSLCRFNNNRKKIFRE